MDFIFFTCMLYYNRSSPKLNTLALNSLLEIKMRIDNDGCVKQEYQDNFSDYCSWLNTTYQSDMKNTTLLYILSNTIKEKLLIQASIDRANRKSNTDLIARKRKAILEALKTSCVFATTPDTNCYAITNSFIVIEYNRELLGEQTFTHTTDFIKERIENCLFHASGKAFNSFVFDAEYDRSDESLTNFEKLLEQSKQNGLTIDQSYNYSFFSEAEYFPFSVASRERFNKLKSQFRNCGEFSQGRGFPVYTDSSKPKFGFGVDETNFLEFTEDLSDEDLDRLLLEYKAQNTYIYDGNYPDVQLQYSETELRELLKISAVKITYHFTLYIPMEKIGFFTINKQEVETITMLES
ncbi:hypothetical protein SDC9_139651 [bioreactor metagenome]|uniref:Uncharacterized protein n=1 Tax=bioreactor metagenome TaxID=1076179 RepID=A0A645DT54_9ZZZZ